MISLRNFSVIAKRSFIFKLQCENMDIFNSYKNLKKFMIRYSTSRPTSCSKKYSPHIIDHVFNDSSENYRAWNVMKNVPAYSSCLITEETVSYIRNNFMRSNDMSADNFIHKFITKADSLEPGNNLEDDSNKELINGLCQDLNQAPFEVIILCLHSLSKWPRTYSSQSTNFRMIWRILDEASCSILKNIEFEKRFLLADSWFPLRLNRLTRYNKKFINSCLLDNFDELNAQRYVQLMFYINLQRQISPTLQKKIEGKLQQVLGNLTIEECGIVAMGFFKTQSYYQSIHTFQAVMNKTIENLDTISNDAFTSIVKSFRKSTHIHSVSSMIHIFLASCDRHIQRFNNHSCMHLCLLGTYSLIYYKSVISKILNKLMHQFYELRIKDLSMLMFTVRLFNHNVDEQFIKLIHKEINRRVRSGEADEHPRSLISYLLSLSVFNIYDEELISKVFNDEFQAKVEKLYGDLPNRDLYALWCGVQIERKDYGGNKLSSSVCDSTEKLIAEIGRKIFESDSFLLSMTKDVEENLKEICLPFTNCVRLIRLLPHYVSPELILALDKKYGHPVQVVAPSTGLKPVPGGKKWICLMIGGKNSYSYQTGILLGSYVIKKRHLRSLGYAVVEIPWFEYCGKPQKEKIRYLKRKLRMDGFRL